MNKKVAVVVLLCVCGAVSACAQGRGKLPKLSRGANAALSASRQVKQLTRQVERAAKASRLAYVEKASLASVVNGYLRTPNVSHFTLPTGQAMRAVSFSRNIRLIKENRFIPAGSLAVVGPKGEISVYQPGETVPQEIKAGLGAAFEEQFLDLVSFVEPAQAEEGLAWPGKTSYNQQLDLVQDVEAYYQGQAEEILENRITYYKARVYRVPARIHYQPHGRAGRYLEPEKDLILLYFSKQDGTPIADGQIIFDGEIDDTWRMFFEPVQQ